MKLKIDQLADALYLTLDEESVVDSEEVAPGVVVDYNAAGQVVGIELLHLSKRTPELETGRLLFETTSGPAAS